MFIDDPGLFNNLLTLGCGCTVRLASFATVVTSGDDVGSMSCFFVAGKSSTSALGVLLDKKTAGDKESSINNNYVVCTG